jgi:hypothetical protein
MGGGIPFTGVSPGGELLVDERRNPATEKVKNCGIDE